MKRPAYQHYVGDWHSDAQLQRCSLAARGLWTEMLGLMHMGIPYGYLTVQMKDTVEGYPLGELAAWVGRPLDEVAQAFAELDAKGVFSRDPVTGHVFSRRMVRDEEIRIKRAEGGKKSLENPNVPKKRTTTKDVLSVEDEEEDEEEVDSSSKEISREANSKPAFLLSPAPVNGNGHHSPKTKRRQSSKTVSRISAFPPEVGLVVNTLYDVWPTSQPKDGKPIQVDLAKFCTRVDILLKEPDVTPELLIDAGKMYIQQKRVCYKAPQHFFGIGEGDEGPPWLGYARTVEHFRQKELADAALTH